MLERPFIIILNLQETGADIILGMDANSDLQDQNSQVSQLI